MSCIVNSIFHMDASKFKMKIFEILDFGDLLLLGENNVLNS